MTILDILGKLLFPAVEHFTPDRAQNFLPLEILFTHVEDLYTVKKVSMMCQ